MCALKLEYPGSVDIDAVLTLDETPKFNDDLKQFKLKRVVLGLKRFVKKRTLPQNAYYWAVVIPILTRGFINVGYGAMTDIKTHSWMKRKYLLGEEKCDFDEMPVLEIIGSTTKLNIERFFEIMHDLHRYGAQNLGVKIPDPDKNWRNPEHEAYSAYIKL